MNHTVRHTVRHVARRLGLAAMLALVPANASAWDPSTTHAEMTRRAVTGSAMHVRWMDGSELQRGVFSSVRLDPAKLPDDVRRRITLALRHAHAAGGAAGLGGPGACPGASAPVSTRAHCVDGDRWELTALGWIQLGMIAEIDPRDRLLHHFADRKHPDAATWKDGQLPRAVLRAEHRRSGGSISETMTGTAFSGRAPSAVAWLADRTDPWAPHQALEQLRAASTAETATARQQALARGLLGVGALLHVVQDLSVPAHARGDITAFFAPLSRTTGDRGLPLQEFVRLEYGRTRLPSALALGPRQATRGVVLSETLRGHLLGDDDFDGLVPVAGHRFLSETSLPTPGALPAGATAKQAATFLLADASLDPIETEGATLSPWPASSGYVLSSGGRPLAAFEVDTVGQVRLFLDRRVYRDQAGHLVPMGVDVSRSLLDLLLPSFPTADDVAGADVLALDLRNWPYEEPELWVTVEDAAGARRTVRRIALRARERNRVSGAIPEVADNERVVLIAVGQTEGLPVTAEKVWNEDSATAKPEEAKTGADETDEAEPDGSDTDEAEPDGGDTEPDGSDTDEAEPDGSDAEPADTEPADGDTAGAAPSTAIPEGVAPKTTGAAPVATPRGPAIPKKRVAPTPD